MASAISAIPSGVTNVVQGEFTTGSTGGTAETFTIPYTGTGYPIAFMAYVKGGPYNNTSSGNTTWYNSLVRYDAGFYSMVKSRENVAPSYNSGADNYGTMTVIYKNSTTSATSYTRTSTTSSVVYAASTADATSSISCIKFKGNGTTVSYYIGNATSTTIGFAKNTTYSYIAIYSS